MFSAFTRQKTSRQPRARLMLFNLLFLTLVASPLYGAALRLDEGFTPSFTHTQAGFEYLNDIKEQKDGKIVVGGWYDFANGIARGRIARINADGSLDTGFNPGTGVNNDVMTIEVLADNKVIVAGYFDTVNGISKKNVARLNADGSVDTAFTVTTDFSVWDISQDTSSTIGHIFIGGQFSTVNGSDRRNVAKLTLDGTLDTSFNPGLGITIGTRVWAVAVLPGSRILVGGDFTAFNSQAYANIVRLNQTGTVDTTFNIGSGANSVVTSLAVQPDGKYLVGGAFTIFNGGTHKGIVRLLDTGAIDPSFSCSVTGGYGEIRSIGLQSEGRIIIGGNFTLVNGVARLNVARLNPDGSLDMEFDPGTGANDMVLTVAVLGQDQVIVGGYFTAINGQNRGRIARFAADPALGGPAANPHTVFAGGKDDWRRISLPRAFVNTASLDVIAEGTLFYMSTLGPPLFARLTYNSFLFAESTGSFGSRWRFLYESSLTQQGAIQVVLQKGSGDRETFTSIANLTNATPGSPVTLSPMKGNFNQLTSYGTYWLYTEKDTRFVYRFDAPALGQKAYLTRITDRNGNALAITVNLATGRISSITDSANRQLLFTFNGSGQCTVITVPDNRRIELAYDAAGQLVQIKDMMGNLGEYTYDNGYLTSTNLDGRMTSFTYGNKKWGSGKYVSSFHGTNGTTLIEPLNGSVNQAMWTTPNGHSTTLFSDKGKTAGIQDPLGAIRNLSFVEGLLTSYTDANGKTKVFQNDSRGNTTRTTDALNHTVNYTYDAKDNLVQRHDASGNDWFYDYNTNGNLIKIRYPNASQVAFGYDAQGRLVSYLDGRNKQTTYAYDAYGNLRSTTYPDGGVLTYDYSANDQYNRCWRIVDTRGNQKNYSYDANNRITAVSYGTTPDAQITYTYDALSLLSATDEHGFTTRAERNDFGLITELIDPFNGSTTFQYDGNNNLIQQKDALGRTIKTTFDSANHPTQSTDPMNSVLKRFYDAEGNLSAITDQRLKTTYFTYDENNRLKNVRNPLEQTVTNTYDANGRVNSTVNARGMTVAFSYDSVGNMASKSFNGTQQVAYTYDSAGNLINANHVATGSIAYTYDNNNRIKTISWPDAKTLTYAYDTEGNLISLTYPDGLIVSSQYDTFSRRKLPAALRRGPVDDISPNREKANQATRMSWSGVIIDFQYDKAANLIGETRSNGTNSTYVFDAKRKVTNIDHRQGTTSFLTLSNTYDAAGSITSSLRSGMISPPFQVMTSTNRYDDADRLLSFGSTAYTSDADGNVTAIGATLTASYDAENKPLSSSINGTASTFSYDGANHPYRIVRGGVTYYYNWDNKGRLLFITDSAGTLLNRYVYRGSRLIAQQAQNGAWYFYHFDSIGNTLALTDGSGNVVTKYAYAPRGLKTQTSASPSNPFTFVGQHGALELADGLYLMGSRFYTATSGRFLQRDPLGLTGGLNLFVYAGNNPVGYIDPEGTESVDPEELSDLPDDQNQQNAVGTADLNSGKLPEDRDAQTDKKIFKALYENTDSALETAASIPGVPIPGGNFTTASRRARDGNYPGAVWEAAKGLAGMIPVYGLPIGLGIEITEAVLTNVPKSAPTPVYQRQYVR